MISLKIIACILMVAVSYAVAEDKCLPELARIAKVKLSVDDLDGNLCSDATKMDEAVDTAIGRLFVSGQNIPLTCSANLFGSIKCKGKKGKSKSEKSKKGKKSRKRKQELKFDVRIECGADPCVTDTSMQNLLAASLSSPEEFRKLNVDKSVDLLGGFDFKVSGKLNKKISLFCSDRMIGSISAKLKDKSKPSRRMKLCGKPAN
jgi:hypothetical protein